MMQKGFTLIELMVVISVSAILGVLGVAGFTNYNQSQVLQVSANEVVTMLNLAKSRAQSQIKPLSLCPGDNNNLIDYEVTISSLKNYTLYINCSVSGTKEIEQQEKTLPKSLSFDSNPTFFFPVQTGGATAGTISIKADSDPDDKKTIVIDASGKISVNN